MISFTQQPTNLPRRNFTGAAISSLFDPVSHNTGILPTLQRKSTCPCGGSCPACQTKPALNVSKPTDPAEIEADQMADKVLRMEHADEAISAKTVRVSSLVESKSGSNKDKVDLKVDFAKTDLSAIPASRGDLDSVVRLAGNPLPNAVRGFFEPRFGTDFTSVRVHTDDVAAASAKELGAKAFTVGTNIVFGYGQFDPSSDNGRRLLAHELSHVVQTSRNRSNGIIFRQPVGSAIDANTSCPAGKAPPGQTAGDAANLSVSNSKNGRPCACLIVIHNNEQNARKTAELMHDHCSYNLAMLNPNTGRRCIKLPGHPTDKNFDPNEFFSPAIIKHCLTDEKSCRDFVKAETGATDTAKIDDFIQMSYFLAVKDCSAGFSLPIVALHNNDINDTANFRKEKSGKDLSPLKKDIDKVDTSDAKEREASDKKQLKPLLDDLEKLFDKATMKELTQKAGKTNIFRWCNSGELSACHIGNPAEPDQVIWVTNRADFDKLKKEPLNVALQDDLKRVKKESLTDLSTTFLTLKAEAPAVFKPILAALVNRTGILNNKVIDLISKIIALRISGVEDDSVTMIVLKTMLRGFQDLQTQNNKDIGTTSAELARYDNLRYLNIETPIHKIADQTDAGRTDNYNMIVSALKAVGLHCCGGKPTEAEDKIKAGLKLSP